MSDIGPDIGSDASSDTSNNKPGAPSDSAGDTSSSYSLAADIKNTEAAIEYIEAELTRSISTLPAAIRYPLSAIRTKSANSTE